MGGTDKGDAICPPLKMVGAYKHVWVHKRSVSERFPLNYASKLYV